MTTLERLRALAEKATPGRWEALPDSTSTRTTFTLVSPGHLPVVRGCLALSVMHENAAHIAAWSPDRALKALDVIKAAQEACDSRPCVVERGHCVTHGTVRLPCDQAALRAALKRWEAEG